jgi:WD repeat-containing protein 26
VSDRKLDSGLPSLISFSFRFQILDIYEFDYMLLHDVAITPDCQRMLAVGPATASPNGRKPSRSRVEKRLLGMLRCSVS